MGKDTFRDWIPAGEDAGAQGSVFKDFVPPKTPEKKEEIVVVADEFKCSECGFVAKSEFGLKSHARKHA